MYGGSVGIGFVADGEEPAQRVEAGGLGVSGRDPVVERAPRDVVVDAASLRRVGSFMLTAARALRRTRCEVGKGSQHSIGVDVRETERTNAGGVDHPAPLG